MRHVSIRSVITDKISGEWGEEATVDRGVAVIRTANFLNSGKIDFTNLVRRQIHQRKVEKKKLMSGDILIEKAGGSPTQPVGRVVLFQNPNNDIYLCNNFTSVLRPDRAVVHPPYLFYALHANHKKGQTLRHQNKTTGIINLKLDSYLESEIPLPPLDDQIRIAHLLGKVEGLIAQRKQHLQQLDDLLKSVFLEMFGDPVRNEKGWALTTIGGLAIDVKYGTSASAQGGQYKYLRMNNITQNGYWDFGSLKHIDVEEKDLEKYSLLKGDLVFNRTNSKDLVGKTAVYDRDETVVIAGYLIRVRFDSRANPWFVWGHLNSKFGKTRLLNLCRNIVGMANINAQELKAIPILKPPIELQKQFALIVEKVEGIRSRYQQSLADLESLYGALSQRAFKGELDLSRVPMPGMQTEEEKSVATEPVHTHTEQSVAINLPDTDNLPDALENAEARATLISHWLEAYRSQLGSTPFLAHQFMAAAQTRVTELYPDNDFALGDTDYEHIKSWVFDALGSGRLAQAFDDAGNRIELKAVQA